eukprot:PITA_16424
MGMQPNFVKSTIIIVSCQPNETRLTCQLFEYARQDLEDGLEYFGFRLKPNGYPIADWAWLIVKIEIRINIWQQRWLSRAGRLTLLKSVLEAILVYWMSLAWIPKGILKRTQQLCCRFLWRGQNSVQVMIRLDAWSGCGNAHILPRPLCNFLQASGISHLAHIAIANQDSWQNQTWMDHKMLNIPDVWVEDRHRFISSLEEANVRISDNHDDLIWVMDPHGIYSPKASYASLMVARHTRDFSWWWGHLSKLKAPPKSRLFMWCILKDKVATELMLMHRAICGPSRCCLCRQHEEDTTHLFLTCPISKSFWLRILT